jgi:hypothetical protein
MELFITLRRGVKNSAGEEKIFIRHKNGAGVGNRVRFKNAGVHVSRLFYMGHENILYYEV